MPTISFPHIYLLYDHFGVGFSLWEFLNYKTLLLLDKKQPYYKKHSEVKMWRFISTYA